MTSSTGNQTSVPWIDNPCPCDVCRPLLLSFNMATIAQAHADPDSEGYSKILEAVGTVGSALEAFYVEHRLQPSLVGLDTATGDISTTQAAIATTSTNERGEPKKFLVCDHCMAHGLICNEASVCNQCREYRQPCIHRWCFRSQDTTEGCTNTNCHYAHMDSIPHSDNEPKWIIWKGRLPEYLERGKLRSLGSGAHSDEEEWLKELNKGQSRAAKVINDKVENGEADYATYRVTCDC